MAQTSSSQLFRLYSCAGTHITCAKHVKLGVIRHRWHVQVVPCT